MNDLRIPAALLGSGTPGAREARTHGSEEADGFDRVIDRALRAEPAPRAKDATPPRNDRHAEQVRSPEQESRNTARAEGEGEPARSQRETPREQAQAPSDAQATPDASSEASSATGASAAATETDSGTPTKAKPAVSTPEAAQSLQLALPLPAQVVNDLQAATAAMVSAAEALSRKLAAPSNAGNPAKADEPQAVGLAKVPPGKTSLSEALPAGDAQGGEQPATDQKSAAARSAKVEAAVLPAAAQVEGRVAAPSRDRLLEDFERRFERSLAAVASGGRDGFTPGTPQALAALSPAPAQATQPVYSVAHAGVGAALGQPGFTEELSHRVLLFAGQRVQNAELAITPADLGPIKVSIEMRGQEASLSFTAAQATTRAAIEDALPRLREMFAGQGLQLAHAHVGDQPRQDARRYGGQAGQGASAVAAVGRASSVAAGGTGGLPTVRGLGLIDIHV